MASTTTSEGKAPFTAPGAGRDCYTWYRSCGDLNGGTVPLIALHGGPGAGHEYTLAFEDLATRYQIPVIFYDQLGCGNSTALPHMAGREDFWTMELFEKELMNLVTHLGLKEYDLLGHSWGGMLGSIYASKHPSGLRKLILMGAPASVDLVLEGSNNLLHQLPREIETTIRQHEERGDYEAQAYKEACLVFYKEFLCRRDPWPPELVASMSHLEEDPTVYGTMFGPSELTCTGNLKGWSAIPELHKIQNTTLILCGEFDETSEEATTPFFEEIPKSKWVVIPNASHMGMWEERERVMRITSNFLKSKA